MKKNIGNADRFTRVVLAIVIMFLFYIKVIEGTLAMVLLLVGIIFLLTSLFGYCPIYSIFNINTNEKKQD